MAAHDRKMPGFSRCIALMVAAAWPGAAFAQDAEPAPAPEAEAAQAADAAPPDLAVIDDHKWHFSTIGYAWLAGAWGETDVIDPAPPVDLDLPFGKVLKAFKFAFMGAAEARKDKFVMVGDLTFIHLEADQGIGIRDPNFLEATLDSRTAEVTLLAGYRVVHNGGLRVDLLAGGRMNWFRIDLELEGPRNSIEGTKKENWFDPIIAARGAVPLGGKWSALAYGDIGGLGIGSDITWQLVGGVEYRLNHKMTAGAGWRYFKVNYDHGDFLYNVHQSGPTITFRTEM